MAINNYNFFLDMLKEQDYQLFLSDLGINNDYVEEYDPEYDDLIIEEYEFSPLLPKGKVL
jgi:hypothetical protein